jgi:hypothetical protein
MHTRNDVFTTVDVAKKCIDLCNTYARKQSLWIDPSCGPSKVFWKHFPTKRKLSIDIKFDPDHRGSFLDYMPTAKNVVVCGNVPFGSGRSVNLALKFINHAIQFAGVVGVIVGASTLRDAMLGKMHGRIVEIRRIPKDSFTSKIACSCVFVVVVPGCMEMPSMPMDFPVLDPVKDNILPNLGVVKMGEIFKPITGKDLKNRWSLAVTTHRHAGQSTVYFLKVSNVAKWVTKMASRQKEAKKIYAAMSTCMRNINRKELAWMTESTEPMSNLVPKILWQYKSI